MVSQGVLKSATKKVVTGDVVGRTADGHEIYAVAKGGGKPGLYVKTADDQYYQYIPKTAGVGPATVINPPSLTISNAQWGKKIGYHMNDFGLDVSNPVHRKQFRNFVEDIGSKPD